MVYGTFHTPLFFAVFKISAFDFFKNGFPQSPFNKHGKEI
jgi:hypothetical protein